jgi:selenocysteine lyase/cysteine desulfurase
MPDFTHEFPLDPDLVHLNHAGVGPWPQRTIDAIRAFAEENARWGSRNYLRWMEREDALREQLRQLINAPSKDDIALLKSTSEALSVVAYGITWQAGENIVTARQEFPSNRVVWQSLAPRFGVETRLADLNDGESPEQALFDLVDENTRLIAVSSVQFATGLRLDLERIGAYCRQHGILLCVDAIQSVGVVPVDVQAIDADFIAADGHKWMLGPEGLALLYCRAERREQLRLNQFGWHMLENASDYERLDWAPAHNGHRFEAGSPNSLGAHALYASLSLLLEVGMPTVSKMVSRNIEYLIDKYNENSLEILSPTAPERRAGIVVFRHPDLSSQALYRHLQARNVLCALRGGGIRFSPHFYTPQTALDRALELVCGAAEIPS